MVLVKTEQFQMFIYITSY